MSGMTQRDRDEMTAIREMAQANAAGLSRHEAVCAERQGEIKANISELRRILIGVAGAVIAGLAATVINLIIHFQPGH